MRNNDVYDIRDCALTSASELSGLSKRSHVRIHLVSSRGIARLDDHETRVHRETRAAESLWDARLDFRQDPLRMMKKLVEMGKETWRNREAVRTARHSSDLSRDAFTHPEDSSLRNARWLEKTRLRASLAASAARKGANDIGAAGVRRAVIKRHPCTSSATARRTLGIRRSWCW